MEKPTQQLELTISWEALLRIVALLVGIWAVITLRDILVMLFVVFIFVAAVNPTISRLQQYMSRTLAVVFFYVLMAAILVMVSYAFVPLLVTQIRELLTKLPHIVDSIQPWLQSHQGNSYSSFLTQATDSISKSFDTISRNFLDNALTFFGGVATLATGLVLSFYLLLEEKNARDFFNQVLPQSRFEAVYDTVTKISERMGGWVRGQLLLMLIIAVLNFISYAVIGVTSPLPLGLWAGVCEAIPYVGPVLGVIPAVVITLTTGSVLQTVLVLAIYVLIQQLESHIIVPKVMEKVLGLSPVLVIIALLVGVKLLGFLGAIVAIPTAAIISVVVGEWHELRKIWQSRS